MIALAKAVAPKLGDAKPLIGRPIYFVHVAVGLLIVAILALAATLVLTIVNSADLRN